MPSRRKKKTDNLTPDNCTIEKTPSSPRRKTGGSLVKGKEKTTAETSKIEGIVHSGLYTDDEHPASIGDLTGYLAKNGMEAHRIL